MDRHSFRIEMNGRTYTSLEEVPPELRPQIEALLADDDGDGVPDIARLGASSTTLVTTQRFDVDGVTYDSLDDVPEQHRERIESMLTSHDARFASAPRPASTSRSIATEASTTHSGQRRPIVTRAGLSGRTKLLLAFVAIDVIVIVVVLAVLLR